MQLIFKKRAIRGRNFLYLRNKFPHWLIDERTPNDWPSALMMGLVLHAKLNRPGF
jgi:hypothetical protein